VPPTKKRKTESEEEEAGTKVLLLSSGPVPCNSKLTDLIGIVKPHIKELVADANLVSNQRLLGFRKTLFGRETTMDL